MTDSSTDTAEGQTPTTSATLRRRTVATGAATVVAMDSSKATANNRAMGNSNNMAATASKARTP